MTSKLRLDFVSDIACPWCVVGLKSLETALDRLNGEVDVELHFQPFELNPQMPPEGEDTTEHMKRKYGSTPDQSARNREMIRARGAELGFTFDMEKRKRIYNTFDAHRLLHWAAVETARPSVPNCGLSPSSGPSDHLLPAAGEGNAVRPKSAVSGQGKQRDLKMALFTAYFTDGKNPSDHAALIEVAEQVGLDPARAKQVLASDEFAKEVREHEQFYLNCGIHAVPSVIINNRHLIQGGQPPEVFERALREWAKETV